MQDPEITKALEDILNTLTSVKEQAAKIESYVESVIIRTCFEVPS